MPLYDVRCKDGHTTEVLVRGASAPLICNECGEPAERLPSVFNVRGVNVPDVRRDATPVRERPRYVERAGGGRAYRTEYGGYRPALTHTATCPAEKRRRNVAVLAVVHLGKRLNCEACGYQWLHRESDAPDPLIEGYDSTLAPGKKFSGFVSNGDQYQTAERGA